MKIALVIITLATLPGCASFVGVTQGIAECAAGQITNHPCN